MPNSSTVSVSVLLEVVRPFVSFPYQQAEPWEMSGWLVSIPLHEVRNTHASLAMLNVSVKIHIFWLHDDLMEHKVKSEAIRISAYSAGYDCTWDSQKKMKFTDRQQLCQSLSYICFCIRIWIQVWVWSHSINLHSIMCNNSVYHSRIKHYSLKVLWMS